MRAVVVGLGQFGKPAAIAIQEAGLEVIAIDHEARPVEDVKDLVALAVRLDATDEQALRDQGVEEADVLLAAIGADFEAQLLTVVHAKALGVKRVLARATTPVHARILALVGADEVLSPEEEAARALAKRLRIPNIEAYFEVGSGWCIVEVEAPEAVVGKTVGELRLLERSRINLVGVRHRRADGTDGPFDPVPAADLVLRSGDVLALVGKDEDLQRFTKS